MVNLVKGRGQVQASNLHSGSYAETPVVVEISFRAYREIFRKVVKAGATNKLKRYDSILDNSHTHLNEYGQRAAYRSIWLVDIGDGFFLMQRDPGPPKEKLAPESLPQEKSTNEQDQQGNPRFVKLTKMLHILQKLGRRGSW